MASTAAKVMFEIYREAGYGRKFRAVYFTELDEHNKESEIARALAGEHLYDSFLSERQLTEGKATVNAILDRLNDGESLNADDLAGILSPYEV